jgi:hypothetical protein
MKYKTIIAGALSIITFGLATSAFSTKDSIVDSSKTFEQCVKGTKAPKDLLDKLCLVNVLYYSTDNKLHRGVLIVDKDVKKDIEEVFELIVKEKFQVKKCLPICDYNWSDSASMADNNSSAFNYRNIAGTNKLSLHALGRAVDINPYFNPYIDNGVVTPKGAKRDVKRNGTFTEEHPIVKKFKELGWRWGGDFQSYKDYHHFDKK